MSRSVAENVRTLRLLTWHAPGYPIYRNYIKLVLLNYTICERDVKARFGADQGREGIAEWHVRQGHDVADNRDKGREWAGVNAEPAAQALTFVQNFNIGLLP